MEQICKLIDGIKSERMQNKTWTRADDRRKSDTYINFVLCKQLASQLLWGIEYRYDCTRTFIQAIFVERWGVWEDLAVCEARVLWVGGTWAFGFFVSAIEIQKEYKNNIKLIAAQNGLCRTILITTKLNINHWFINCRTLSVSHLLQHYLILMC